MKRFYTAYEPEEEVLEEEDEVLSVEVLRELEAEELDADQSMIDGDDSHPEWYDYWPRINDNI